MHVRQILHKLLTNAIHKTRIKTLEALLTGLIDSKVLKLTNLGRSIPTSGKERSGILRVDRFLRNKYFQQNYIEIYERIASFVIGNNKSPDIIVDWSKLPNSHYIGAGKEHNVLRASLAVEGRAITIYEEVHPKALESNPRVHASFLKKYGKSHREPWVIVSSFTENTNAKKVINKYKSKMTIEENIMDTKSVNYGLSMNENQTIKPERYIVWLMLAALASLIAWITGFVAEQNKLHFDFQANTYEHRRVLSFFYLGCQIIRKKIPLKIDLRKVQFLNLRGEI